MDTDHITDTSDTSDTSNTSSATSENAPGALAKHTGASQAPRRTTSEKPQRAIFVAVALLVACLLGLMTFQVIGASGATQQPNMLQAVRTPGLNPRRGPMMRIVVDAQSVQRLYTTILKLPHIPRNAIFSCPTDDGTMWTLTFWHGTTTVAHVTVDDMGCQFLFINGQDGRMTALSNFWQVFAATIALPQSQV